MNPYKQTMVKRINPCRLIDEENKESQLPRFQDIIIAELVGARLLLKLHAITGSIPVFYLVEEMDWLNIRKSVSVATARGTSTRYELRAGGPLGESHCRETNKPAAKSMIGGAQGDG